MYVYFYLFIYFQFQHKICIPWKGDFINETFPWFSEERDPVLNSDVYEVAANIIQKIFSGSLFNILNFC